MSGGLRADRRFSVKGDLLAVGAFWFVVLRNDRRVRIEMRAACGHDDVLGAHTQTLRRSFAQIEMRTPARSGQHPAWIHAAAVRCSMVMRATAILLGAACL